MINYIYWDPKKIIFYVPGINWPIAWYSIYFLIGFLVGYYIFINVLKRYYSLFINLDKKDVVSFELIQDEIRHSKNEKIKKVFSNNKNLDSQNILSRLNNFIDNNIKNRSFIEKAFKNCILSIKRKAFLVTDKITIFMVVATLIGARLGHIVFYEDISLYLRNPIEIIKFWDGGISGLASHGAAVFIMIALVFFLVYYNKKYYPKLTYLQLLDFICIPTAFAGFCIRIGNFFNQEILGKVTSVPWAIIFMHPADGGPILPRHPVQLYESAFYLLTFGILFYLSHKKYFFKKQGKLIGLFFILVFLFRFFIEFFKVKQSDLLQEDSFILMGQYLSIPFVIIGIIFYFWTSFFKKKSSSLK